MGCDPLQVEMSDTLYLEALREVDAITPGSPRLAPDPPLNVPRLPPQYRVSPLDYLPKGQWRLDELCDEYVSRDGKRLPRWMWLHEPERFAREARR